MRAQSLRAQRGRIHDGFQIRLRPRGVIAEGNVDVVTKVGEFPVGALDYASHTARPLPGKVVPSFGIKEMNGCPVAQSRRRRAERELSFKLGRHLLNGGLA